MKKLLSLITALLLIFSLSACSNHDTKEAAYKNSVVTEEATEEATETTVEKTVEKEKKSSTDKKENNDSQVDSTAEEDVKKEESKEVAETTEENETPQIETEVITPSEKKDDNRPTVYWATSEDKDTSDVCYHKKDCSVIKDKKPAELPWEIIDALGMPACEKCKPN